MSYSWRKGSRFKVKPDVAGEALNQIYERDGKITPQAVVDDARPISSPLHEGFEWDNWKAAEHYRERQARAMIRNIEIVSVPGEPPEPKFVNVISLEGQYYEPAIIAVQKVDIWESVMREIRRSMLAYTEKLKTFQGMEDRWKVYGDRAGATQEVAQAVEVVATKTEKALQQ